MSGSSGIPFFEQAQGVSLTVPGPLDDRTVISEVSNLSTELATGVRYPGLLVWVENSDFNNDGDLDGIGEYYLFNNGIDDNDFVSLRNYISNNGGVTTSIAFVYESPLDADVTYQLAHNLNNTNLLVQFYDGLDPLLMNWSIPDFDPSSPLTQANTINFTPNIGLENARVVVTFVNTLFVDPPSLVVDDTNLLLKSTLRTISSDSTVSIPANSKVESIDYRPTVNPVIIKCGTTVGGSEIHDEITITDYHTELFHKIFGSSSTLYFTITSGIVDINVNLRQSIF